MLATLERRCGFDDLVEDVGHGDGGELRSHHVGRCAVCLSEEFVSGRPISPGLPGFDRPTVILVHHVGAKSGEQRINPLWFRWVDNAFAVFGTSNGAPRHPAWYHNLMARPGTFIETATGTVAVRARATAGAERDQIWRAELDDVPLFVEIERRSGRTIPVVLLEPRPGH